MKRSLSFLIAAIMLVLMVVPAFAASDLSLIYHLRVDDSYEVTVPSGSIVEVSFALENKDGEEYSLKRLQNEIYYDHNFFEFVEGSAKAVSNEDLYFCDLKVSSDDEHRVYVNSIETASYEAKQTVATFKLRVKEETKGAYSIVESKLPFATGQDGDVSIEEKNLKVIIGTIDPEAKKHSIRYYDGTNLLNVDVDILSGSTTNLRLSPVKEGYIFTGWEIDGIVLPAGSEYTVTADTVAKATWKKDETVVQGGGGTTGGVTERRTITFQTADGVELGKAKRILNSVVNLSEFSYTKTGCVFEGWYTDKELTQKVTEIKLTEDIVLYANWIERESGDAKPNYHPDMLTTEHYAYIVGRENNLIAPEDFITRAEVATIFFRLLTEEVRNTALVKENGFADVSVEDWHNTAVSTVSNREILKGRDAKNFAPDAHITRAEFTTIAARFSDAIYQGEDLFSDIDGHWAEDYINAAASVGWIVGENGVFRPDDNITRAEVMTLVNRMLNRIPEGIADLADGMTTWKDNSDVNAWYYLAVQEATNSHGYEIKENGIHERWTGLKENPDWSILEQ